MDKAKRAQIVSIIDDVNDMTVATLRPDLYPQATTVSYVNEGLTIYFGTSPDSQKAKNLAWNNKVSLTIDRPYETWNEIEGVSMGAEVSPVTDAAEVRKVGELMLGKFPQLASFVPDDASTLALFRVEPKFISLLDYSQGFGHTELFTLDL
jgi:general stress protein 26